MVLWLATAGWGARALMGRASAPARGGNRPGPRPGDPADLVVVAGDTVTAAVMDRLNDRTVIFRGSVVADALELTEGSRA